MRFPVATSLMLGRGDVCHEAPGEEPVALLQLRGVRARSGAADEVIQTNPCTGNSTILDDASGTCVTLAEFSSRNRKTTATPCPAPGQKCQDSPGCFLGSTMTPHLTSGLCYRCSALTTPAACDTANYMSVMMGSVCVWNDGACVGGATVVLGRKPTKSMRSDLSDMFGGVQYRPFATKPLRYDATTGEWVDCTDSQRCPQAINFELSVNNMGVNTGGFWRTGSATDTCSRDFKFEWPVLDNFGRWKLPVVNTVANPRFNRAYQSQFVEGSHVVRHFDQAVPLCRQIVACKAVACTISFQNCVLVNGPDKPHQTYYRVFTIDEQAKNWGACAAALPQPRLYHGVGFDVTLRCPHGAEFLRPQILIVMNKETGFLFQPSVWTVQWDREVLPVTLQPNFQQTSTCWVSWNGGQGNSGAQAGCPLYSTDPNCAWRSLDGISQFATISCQLRVPTTVPQQHVMKVLYTGTEEQVIRITNALPRTLLNCEDRKFCLDSLFNFPFAVAENFRADNTLQARCILGYTLQTSQLQQLCVSYRNCLSQGGNLQALQATARAAGLDPSALLVEEDAQEAAQVQEAMNTSSAQCSNPSAADLQGLTCNCLETWERRCTNILAACNKQVNGRFRFRESHVNECNEVLAPSWSTGACVQSMFCFDDSVCHHWKVASGCSTSGWRKWYAGRLTIRYDEGDIPAAMLQQEPGKPAAPAASLSATGGAGVTDGDVGATGSSVDNSRTVARTEAATGGDAVDGPSSAAQTESVKGGDAVDGPSGVALNEQFPGTDYSGSVSYGTAYAYQPPPPISYQVKHSPAYTAPNSEVKGAGYTSFSRRRCMFSPLATGQ
mmetsp:Transcript_20892/g.46690  ORF Transcript_20892/g.46690 Transcript_20892/m.46690 type:complete len:836 (+) Transcript_20892:78-2585(+)